MEKNKSEGIIPDRFSFWQGQISAVVITENEKKIPNNKI